MFHKFLRTSLSFTTAVVIVTSIGIAQPSYATTECVCKLTQQGGNWGSKDQKDENTMTVTAKEFKKESGCVSRCQNECMNHIAKKQLGWNYSSHNCETK